MSVRQAKGSGVGPLHLTPFLPHLSLCEAFRAQIITASEPRAHFLQGQNSPNFVAVGVGVGIFLLSGRIYSMTAC